MVFVVASVLGALAIHEVAASLATWSARRRGRSELESAVRVVQLMWLLCGSALIARTLSQPEFLSKTVSTKTLALASVYRSARAVWMGSKRRFPDMAYSLAWSAGYYAAALTGRGNYLAVCAFACDVAGGAFETATFFLSSLT